MTPRILVIPHRPAAGMCPVNGIRDLVDWRCGHDWSDEFVHGLGLGGGFAYLRINPARPPRQVFWGNSTPRQHAYLAELLGAGITEVDGRSFKFAWGRAREAVDAGTPPVLGPLDMYHLHFCDGLYQRVHVPIHSTSSSWATGTARHTSGTPASRTCKRSRWRSCNRPGT